MNKNSKCGCYKKCSCNSDGRVAKRSSKISGKGFKHSSNVQEAKLGSSSNPIHFAIPSQNNDYDVKLNTLFGKHPYRNVLGNYGELKSQGIGVFFNQGMPSNETNVRDLENSNGLDMNMTEDRLGFNSNADLDTMFYDDWTHAIPNTAQNDMDRLLYGGDWTNAIPNTAQDDMDRLLYGGDWNSNINSQNDLMNAILSPNITLDQIQDDTASPLDAFLQPVQNNYLTRDLFPRTPNMKMYLADEDDEEEIPKEYLDEEDLDEEEEYEVESPMPNEEEDHRWLFYGVMPNFSDLDGVDPNTFTRNRNDYANYINEVRDYRADELRGAILFKSEGIRGESKSKFERRTKKQLRELYAKVSLFKDYNSRGFEL
jgi:hypothetical protein